VTGWDVLVGTALLYVLIWHSLSDRMTPRDEQDGIKAGWTREDRARARRLFGL
jgi:hypothetical protein